MKKLLSIMLVLLLALCSLPALADHGAADVEFNNETYHFVFESAEIVDGELVVKVRGENSIPIVGGAPRTPALAVADIGGQRIMPHTVEVSINDGQAEYAYTLPADGMPDAAFVLESQHGQQETISKRQARERIQVATRRLGRSFLTRRKTR